MKLGVRKQPSSEDSSTASNKSAGHDEEEASAKDTEATDREALTRAVEFLPVPDPLPSEHYQTPDGQAIPLRRITAKLRGNAASVTYTFKMPKPSESSSRQSQGDLSPRAESSKARGKRREEPFRKSTKNGLSMQLGRLKIRHSRQEQIELSYPESSEGSKKDGTTRRRRRR
ncbi:MAG: hypothetical protein Q9162_004722 [Coniocarpon cinnabarinum]